MKYMVLRKMLIYAPSCASWIQFPPLLLRFHYPVNTFLVPEYKSLPSPFFCWQLATTLLQAQFLPFPHELKTYA
jgi:hypothetical protein